MDLASLWPYRPLDGAACRPRDQTAGWRRRGLCVCMLAACGRRGPPRRRAWFIQCSRSHLPHCRCSLRAARAVVLHTFVRPSPSRSLCPSVSTRPYRPAAADRRHRGKTRPPYRHETAVRCGLLSIGVVVVLGSLNLVQVFCTSLQGLF